MKKKGQSEIITTILLILIVLAAVIIVWQVINRFVGKGEEAVTTKLSCIDVRLDIVEAKSTGSVKVTRQAGGADDAVKNIKILVEGEAATATDPAGGGTLTPLQTKTWTVSAPSIAAGNEVQVAAVLSDDTICDIGDTITAVT